MEFEKLLIQITDKELLEKIKELLDKKRSGIELGIKSKIQIVNDFIENMLEHLGEAVTKFDPQKKPKQELLEDGFIKILEHMEIPPWLSCWIRKQAVQEPTQLLPYIIYTTNKYIDIINVNAIKLVFKNKNSLYFFIVNAISGISVFGVQISVLT